MHSTITTTMRPRAEAPRDTSMADVADLPRAGPGAHPSGSGPAVERSRASLAAIATEVAELYGLSVGALRSRTRRHDISHPRQHAMALMRAQTRPDGSPRYSCQQIANYFGAKDHTTVAYGVKAHARRTGGRGS